MARPLGLLLAALALALALARPWLMAETVRMAVGLALRLLQLLVLAVGAGSFWWALRSYQLALEQELFDQALQRFRYYRRYRSRTSSGGSSAPPAGRLGEPSGDGMLDAGFQLRVLKRLPISAHLRTSWGLPDALSEEIAALSRLLVRDYVSYWFAPISPSNDEFPHDVKFLIADLLGAIASRLMEIDSSQALTMVAKGVELFRMHLGWFREAYAQLAEEYPDVFDAEEETDENLAKRQEYVRAYVQRSQFVHPGCIDNQPETGKKCAETAEALYLRHLATQLLVQLKPQFGQQYDTNLFVSIAVNLLREITAFKVLKPLTEYAQPRYANEVVVASLGDFIDDKDAAVSLQSQTTTTTAGAMSARPSLNKLRMTGSFLYKASKRSSETAEAAFQALVDAVSSAATTATTGAAESMFDGDEWSDSAAFTLGSSVFSALAPQSSGASGDRKTITSLFSLDERINLPKASRLMATPRNLIAAGSSLATAHKTSGDSSGRSNTHLDDLKNVKANIGSSLNSSLGKVKKRFRTLSGHPNEQGQSGAPHSSSSITGSLSSNAAARMIRKPGQLFQKAWKRNESGHGVMSPGMSMGESFDDLMTPPTTPDGESRIRSNARVVDEPFDDDDAEIEEECEEEEAEVGVENGEDEPVAVEESGLTRASDDINSFSGVFASRGSLSSQRGSDANSSIASPGKIADRVVLLLEKTVTNYVRMFNDRPEMRSSARSRELYELLSALEDVLMLGYQSPTGQSQSNDNSMTRTSDLTGRASDSTVLMMSEDDLVLQSPPQGHRLSSPSCFFESDPSGADLYYYWNYLAQDRPGTPLLNDHWRFIATRCPPCCESDSFVSTRGVQWLLVALEKGLLWEFFTGLRLHADVTQQFYEEYSVLSDAKRFDSVLKSLRQLNNVKVSLEIPLILGRKSEMDQEFGVSPTSSRSHATSPTNSVVRVLESVWETERYVPIQGWVKAQDKRRQELPSSEWVWEGEWTLEKLEGDAPAVLGDSSDSERGTGGGAHDKVDGSWEYAKTFEDRFHEKEKKFDSVRRRRWIRKRRQLPLVLVLALSPSSVSPLSPSFSESVKPETVEGASGIVRRRSGSGAMNGLSKARRLKNRIDMFARDKADKLEKAAKAKAGRPLVKRRSFSFDKSSPTSPILTPGLGALNVELDAFRNAAAALEGAADGNNSVSDVRRKSLGKPASNTSGIYSREISSQISLSGYEDDVEDNSDDDLCFRCLKALPPADAGICHSCHQRVCASCHNFFAFTTFPPPLESTKKNRVCGNCYDRLVSKYKLRVEAHVGKYLIKEKDRELPDLFGSSSAGNDSAPASTLNSSLSSPTGTSSSNPRFELTMRIKGESAYAWAGVKTFHDFELLEKELLENLKKQEKKHGAGCKQCHWKGIDYAELHTVEPSLRKLPIAALSYEKRLYVLEEFLQSLLACDTLGQSSAVQKFLLLTNGGVSANGAGGSTSAGQSRDGTDTGSFGSAGASDGATGSTQVGSGASGAASGSLVMENGKWKKGRWIAPDANSKETKMRVLQKMEVSLFAALSEVFEFDGIGAVRRHLFSVTRSFIKAFLSASHFRMLERQVLSLTEPKKLAAGVHALRDYMFPPATAPVVPPAPELTTDEMRALRGKCLDALLASFPSKLVSLMGESACANAALKVHDFLQHEVMVKNLLFSLADELLLHLFPEASVYKLQPRSAVSAHSAPASPTHQV